MKLELHNALHLNGGEDDCSFCEQPAEFSCWEAGCKSHMCETHAVRVADNWYCPDCAPDARKEFEHIFD